MNLCVLRVPAPPMRTKVNRLDRFGDFRFPAPRAWCMSLSYSQCRAAVDGFVARLHSIIHPAGVQPPRRTRGARHGTRSPADGTFRRFRIGLRSSSWLRLLFPEPSAGISAGIRGPCGRPHCRRLLLAPPRRRHIRRIRPLGHRRHQDRGRPRHRGYGPALRHLRAPCAHPPPPGLEAGVGRAVAQDHLRAFDRVPPHGRGSRLRYAALPVDVPGPVLPRREAEPRPHVSRLPEPVHVPARHRRRTRSRRAARRSGSPSACRPAP